MAREYFEKAKVPMIINDIILNSFTKYLQPIAAFYQLQFIFDAIDSKSSSITIVELLLKGLKKFQKITIPSLELIETCTKSKKYLVFLNYSNDEIDISDVCQNISTKNEIEKPKTYKERAHKDQLIKKLEEEYDVKYDKFIPSDEFWTIKENEYEMNDEILLLKSCNNALFRDKKIWDESIEKIYNEYHKNSNIAIDINHKSCILPNFNTKKESELYKIIYYDENENKWCFDSNRFEQFLNDKRINYHDFKISLVLYMNSNDQDVISFNSNFILDKHPNINSENQILVYLTCDKVLSLMKYKIELSNNDESSSFKPIFFLLQVPKSKINIPNIQIIVTQIYIYFLSICNVSILILNTRSTL